MSFLDWLLRRKPGRRHADADSRRTEGGQVQPSQDPVQTVPVAHGPAASRFPKLADGAPEVLTRTATSVTPPREDPTPAVNIWDIEADPPSEAPPAPETGQPPTPATPPRRRTSRNRTRVLGFEPQPLAVVPLFDEGRMQDLGEPGAKSNMVMFPTGWLVVKSGPGRGAAFALSQGVSQIGRGTDQTVALDFGDMAISRQNHASIAYDGATHRFHIGHGGKSNLVRLNGRPLLSTEELREGDEIQIGETTLVLKVLCTPAFNWSSTEAGGDGHDVAIA